MTKKPREVTNLISSGNVMKETLFKDQPTHVEVKQKANGEWRVFYPDPGWIACLSDCKLRHKHDVEPAWIESAYKPVDYQDALVWAHSMAAGREIRIIEFVPINQRKRRDDA